jgi:hypothetical protein
MPGRTARVINDAAEHLQLKHSFRVGLVGVTVLAAAVGPCRANPGLLPGERVKPGMVAPAGRCLPATPSKFKVNIIGVLQNVMGPQRADSGEARGGPLATTGAYQVSGSPV